MPDEHLFFSDCHLDQGRPETDAVLIRFLDGRATDASHIYILGDLFEVWLGDDDPADGQHQVIESLRRLARIRPVYFISGNRDFLLGSDFASHVGLTLLDEPQVLDLGQRRVVLIHGDTLCTDDHDYQAFRTMVRDPAWQVDFLRKPLAERQQIAIRLRKDSNDAMSQKTLSIMDVNQQAVLDCFRKHSADTIIHGHTHRPAVHDHAPGLTRYVLGDWNPGPSFLSWTEADGFNLVDPGI